MLNTYNPSTPTEGGDTFLQVTSSGCNFLIPEYSRLHRGRMGSLRPMAPVFLTPPQYRGYANLPLPLIPQFCR